MNVQEFFYWTLSIAAILVGVFMIVMIAVLLYVSSLAKRNFERIAYQVEEAGKTWRTFAFSRFIIRILRIIL